MGHLDFSRSPGFGISLLITRQRSAHSKENARRKMRIRTTAPVEVRSGHRVWLFLRESQMFSIRKYAKD